jgi:hypothetical protein
MNFWKSGTIRWALGAAAAVVLTKAAELGLDLGVTADQIVDAIVTLGTLVSFMVIVVKRVKAKPTPIDRDTVPVPVAKLAGNGKKTATVLLLVAILGSTACSGLVGNASRSMAAFEAAYTIEEPIRAAFCKDKDPQPPACPKAQAIVKNAYASYQAFASAFALYLELKTDAAKANIIALLPSILDATAKISTLVTELK